MIPPAIQAAMRRPMDIMMSMAGRAAVMAPVIPSSISFHEKWWKAPTAAAKTEGEHEAWFSNLLSWILLGQLKSET